jgi:hypothetical protein
VVVTIASNQATATPISAVQNAHRFAAFGISLKHSGHARAGSSSSGDLARRSAIAFTGFTTKKNTAAATETNVIAALMKSP